MTARRDAEDELASALGLAGDPFVGFERQYAYVPGRKFRADFAWPASRLLVEIQGGVFTGQAHGSVKGVLADIERLNLATLNGWRLLRFTTACADRAEVGETLDVIEKALTNPAGPI